MAEYIEREALLKGIDEFHHTAHIQSLTRETEEAKILWKGIHSGVNYSRNHIIEAPTADVVVVVRCKNCIHLKNDTEYCKTHNKYYCELDDTIKSLTHYCAYGERKPKETVSLVDGHIDKSNRCISCGAEIPEGTWTCPSCDRRWE